ncbi:hypothetical protein F5887DRAFT_1241645 [Amanita rubescens]|nr:hypothetical protein F5887DRAFT_1241645 [Amanita rubescens]
MPMWVRVRQAFLHLLTLFLLVCATQARLVNISIDDTYGDHTTGQIPVYQPIDGFWYRPAICNEGISIWVFFILPNVTLDDGHLSTQCNFTLDGNYVDTFTQSNTTPDILYNVLAFNASGLSNSQHNLFISAYCVDPSATYLNFDYAIYTADILDNSTSTASTTGTISTIGTPGLREARYSSSHSQSEITVGCVLGGIGLVVLVVVVFILLRFRRFGQKQKGAIAPLRATSFNQPPHQNNNDLPWQNSILNGNPDPSKDFLRDRHSSMTRSPAFRLASESETPVPFPPGFQLLQVPSAKNKDEIRAARQMEINRRIQTAQQEMRNFTSRQPAVSSPDSSSPSEVRRQGMEHEIGTLREQMYRINGRIGQLQMQLSSDWARGPSDEPPPAYYY